MALFCMHTIHPCLSSTGEPRTRHSTWDVVSIKFNQGEKPPPWTCWQDSYPHSPGYCRLPLPQGHSMQQGMWLFCLRYRTWHFPLSNFMGLLSANYSSVSRSLCMAAQPSAISNTFQLSHLYSNKTKQESHPVLNTIMWLSLLMTPTLWS